jgi:hypothetical protein
MATKTSKFVRVAVSGPTIDGRTIDPNMLIQAAKNYDPNTYAARVNVEHVRGTTGQSPFKTVGDVTALKTEPVNINVAGQTEQRIALLAQIDAHDDLVNLNKDGQKLYTSVELLPNFAGKNEAYLGGLAVTDSPASLGTERLHFTAHAKVHGNLVSEPHETKLEFEAEPAAQADAAGAFAAMRDFFTNLMKPPAAAPVNTAPAAAVIPPASPEGFTAFSASMTEGLAKMAAAIEAGQKANETAVAKVSADLAAFKTEVATSPANSYTARPAATGGTGDVLAEC